MARIILWLAATLASVVLIFGYPSSTAGPASSVQAGRAIPGLEASAVSPATSRSESTSSTRGESAGSQGRRRAATGTYTGDDVSTRYGPVQVQVTTAAGTVTEVKVLQVPWSNGEDKAINGRAVPDLNAQVVDGNAKDVHAVSGASYTSSAYIDSLQSALDRANS